MVGVEVTVQYRFGFCLVKGGYCCSYIEDGFITTGAFYQLFKAMVCQFTTMLQACLLRRKHKLAIVAVSTGAVLDGKRGALLSSVLPHFRTGHDVIFLGEAF